MSDGTDGSDRRAGDHDLADVPRQLARTQRFSLGAPRQITVAEDGSRVLFRRTRSGTDRTGCLWVLDGQGERLLADPDALTQDATGAGADVPAAERARRERVRERTTGVVSYSADRMATRVVVSFGGGLWLVEVDGPVRLLPAAGAPVDPRLDPTGRRVAYVADGSLHVLDTLEGTDRVLARAEAPEVTYGLAEHAAAEEMHRLRGHWWSPDGTALLVARVDNTAVTRWWIADPSDPSVQPRQIFYPAAGTPNPDVSLFVMGLDGGRIEVTWDRRTFEYLARAGWDRHGPIASVQSRDQRTLRVLGVDPSSGSTSVLAEQTDAFWVSLVLGTPARTEAGRLVVVSESDGCRRLVVGGRGVTQDGVQVREVLDVQGETVWFVASTDPTEAHVWTFDPEAGAVQLTRTPGLHAAAVGGGTVVVESFTDEGHVVTVTGSLADGLPAGGDVAAGDAAAGDGRVGEGARITIRSLEAVPLVDPEIQWLSIGPRGLRAALVLPRGHAPGARRLPVILSPYAGPAMQRVTRARHWYFVEAQWFADQGFAVLIADGAGTPGRGPDWDRAICGDVLSPVIADQVTALHGAAERCPDLDLGRVAIRGWSYGGLLALTCVIRRPDVFHAAVAGAAPTDMRLYDTHYRERYLGHPAEHPEHYDRCSPVLEAASLTRPLLMIHGLADDNVVVANTLRMSAALLAAGRPHEVLLLPSATHMAIDPDVSANLDLYELRFIERSLPAAVDAGR